MYDSSHLPHLRVETSPSPNGFGFHPALSFRYRLTGGDIGCKLFDYYDFFTVPTENNRYLPPPVLAVLDNKRLESAKRAALITTSLKWALDHIPVLMIPLQMHPVLSVLKNLVPYLGYVGGFIAWSWGAIKTFDKGKYEYVLHAF